VNLYVITGTTKGLGHELAAQASADAANHVVTLSRATATESNIEVDLADRAAVERACDELERRIAGRAYAKAVLVNNAGMVTPVGPLEKLDAAALERNLAVNLLAPMLLMRRFLAATETAPLRRIINISSGAARRPIFGWSAYCAAKAGLDMASRAVALEAQARGWPVEVSSLAPGVVDTPMQATVRAASPEDFPDIERFRAMKAEGVLRPPAEVAAEILRAEAAGKLQGDAIQDLRQIA
jgi:benzil reductase ((S)-benzoin forming)